MALCLFFFFTTLLIYFKFIFEFCLVKEHLSEKVKEEIEVHKGREDLYIYTYLKMYAIP